jgi:hypothetical protein
MLTSPDAQSPNRTPRSLAISLPENRQPDTSVGQEKAARLAVAHAPT